MNETFDRMYSCSFSTPYVMLGSPELTVNGISSFSYFPLLTINRFVNLTCDNCSQKYTSHTVNIAVSLYGIFFLVGKRRKGFIGITCPKCLKTIIVKMRFKSIIETKNQFLIDDRNNSTRLAYNSSVIYSLNQVPGIEQYDIPCFKRALSGNTTSEYWETFETSFFEWQQQRPELGEEYLCSYIPGINQNDDPLRKAPRGTFFLALFCRPDQVVGLVNLEEETGLKIFPRYYFGNSVIDRIETFVGKHYPWAELVEEEKQRHASYAQMIREELTSRGIDWRNYSHPVESPERWDEQTWDAALKTTTNFINGQNASTVQLAEAMNCDGFDSETRLLLSEALSDGRPGFFELLSDLQKKAQDIDTTLPSDFLNCLTADFAYHDYMMPVGKEPELLCREENPFAGKDVRSDFQVDLQRMKSQVQRFQSDAKMLTRDCSKVYVQQFLTDHVEPFITEYIEAAIRKDFSFAKAWQLQRRYLDDLYEEYQKGLRSDAEYAFFREGKTWTIKFEGYAIRGLDSIGFLYIRHLISQPRQPFYHSELAKITDGPSWGTVSKKLKKQTRTKIKADDDEDAENLGYGDEIDLDNESLTFGRTFSSNIQSETPELSADQRAEAIADWKKKIAESESRGDKGKMKDQQRELNKLISGSGLTSKFKDQDLKNVQTLIGHSINRAINEIAIVGANAEKNKKEILKAFNHFNNALTNLYETSISYRPEVDIEWHF